MSLVIIQVLVTKEVAEESGLTLNKLTPTGTSVLVEGELAATPEGTKQVGPTAPGVVVVGSCVIQMWCSTHVSNWLRATAT